MKFINIVTFKRFVCVAGITEMKFSSTDKKVGVVL